MLDLCFLTISEKQEKNSQKHIYTNLVSRMEWDLNSVIFYIIITSVTLITLILLRGRQKLSSGDIRLPPGPPGWPVFGYMFSLGSMPHITLAALSQKYGPVMWLKLGSKGTLVIQNSETATQLFKNHDLDFADRSITEVLRSHDTYKGSLALAPYGMYWRVLRRIVTVEMLMNKRLNESSTIREKCAHDMLSWISKEADLDGEAKRGGIHVAHFVFAGAFNVMGNLLFSRDLVNPQSQLASDMYTITAQVMMLIGAPNISDFFPWLRRLDLQGLRRRMDRSMGKAIEICSSYVEERLKEHKDLGRGRENRKDFLDVLLDYEGNGVDEPAKLSTHNICLFLLDVIFGGTETTSSTVEWGMTELLRRPEAMMKLRAELARVVGPNKRLEESHIDRLPYLQAVMKETLRLHPPVPFLIPRKSIPENANFMGYKIPRNTQVFVNAWAIGRDPECWDDEPLCFKPERFLGLDGSFKGNDYKGQNFEMVPFGGGRRTCPSIPLAQRVVPLFLGSLIYNFEWELENNVSGVTMDMRERIGVTLSKLEPL